MNIEGSTKMIYNRGISIGEGEALTLDETLEKGQYRMLTEKEVQKLL